MGLVVVVLFGDNWVMSKQVDWAKIEIDYCAGIKSNRAIADEYGVTEIAVRRRAKKLGWLKNLSPQIAKKMSRELQERTAGDGKKSKAEVVEANAVALADVRMAQREDIERSKRISRMMLEELELQAGVEQIDLLSRLGDLMRQEDDKGRDELNDLYRKVISLPERVRTMKSIAEAQKIFFEMESKAYGLDKYDDMNREDPLKSLLHVISSGVDNAFSPVSVDPEFEGNDE